MFIGDVEIPIVLDITDDSESNVEEIKPLKQYGNRMDSVPVKHDSQVQTVTIFGFVNEELHGNSYSLDRQKEEIKTLRTKEKLDNPIDYKDYKGFLLIEDIDFLGTNDSRVVDELEIIAKYFPWPQYYPIEGSLDFIDGVYGEEDYSKENYGE